MRFGGFTRIAFGALAALSQHFTIPFLPPMVEGPRPPQPRGFKKQSRYRGRKRGHSPNETGWFRRHAVIDPLPVTEKMLMRHGWYRRKLRNEAANANL